MTQVLIVEDEAHLADGLRFNLEAEGYEVQVAETGEEALEILRLSPSSFDVLVLDVMLPGQDGFAVMSELRRSGQFVPTLMLTARSRSDDYLPKPFELDILIARIHGLVRRRDWLTASRANSERAQPAEDTFTFGDKGEKAVKFDSLELSVRGQGFRLTLMEANLLRYLIRHEGKVVSRKTMIEEVWGLQEDTDTRPIDNFIVRLRRYIEDDPTSPRHLLTVRGVGYRFVANPDSSP
jgi:two-component system, OmpR family, alkaline phosphatase synthesis response regulator PhoP